jgi:hypothetical protein
VVVGISAPTFDSRDAVGGDTAQGKIVHALPSSHHAFVHVLQGVGDDFDFLVA